MATREVKYTGPAERVYVPPDGPEFERGRWTEVDAYLAKRLGDQDTFELKSPGGDSSDKGDSDKKT